MTKKLNTVLKMLSVVVSWFVLDALYAMFVPIATNEIALGQFEDTMQSYTNLSLWKNLISYYWVLYILSPLLIFSKNIKNLFKKTRRNLNK